MCYQMRADPVNQKMKALIDEAAVGNISIVRRRHAIGVLFSPDFAKPGNWHIDKAQNMGMFMDDASHAADWFYWMLGRPTSVIAEIDNIVTTVAPDDNGVAVYRFGKKEMGILCTRRKQPPKFTAIRGRLFKIMAMAHPAFCRARQVPARSKFSAPGRVIGRRSITRLCLMPHASVLCRAR
jgi:predicted dehydrogenase